MSMRLGDFDYDLPADRIAQRPAEQRDASRLLVLPVSEGPAHRAFGDLAELLGERDLLVFNDTRVVPARLLARKPTGGRVEVLLLRRRGGGPSAQSWECLLRASRAPRPGERLTVEDALTVDIESRVGDHWEVTLAAGDVDKAIASLGRMPLPPYIRRDDDDPRASLDRQRYQTIYARRPGAVAAPTAGLHFTAALLERLRSRGVEQVWLTLHVGLGTFAPLRDEQIERNRLHSESFALPEETAAAIDRTRRRGGRVVAVGTTVVRVLEHRARGEGGVEPGEGECDLFIVPGFRFRVVDAMVTNFHLPRSTLLMLVSAFAGRERVLAAYREAVTMGYRFYSYGDAMFLERA